MDVVGGERAREGGREGTVCIALLLEQTMHQPKRPDTTHLLLLLLLLVLLLVTLHALGIMHVRVPGLLLLLLLLL